MRLPFPRYSLRALLLGATLIAVLCSYITVVRRQTAEDELLVRAVQQNGGLVAFDYQWSPKTFSLNNNAHPPCPTCLRGLLGRNAFAEVVYVGFQWSTSVDLPLIRDWHGLLELDLSDTMLATGDLDEIGVFPDLRKLDLAHTDASDEELRLVSALAELERLDLTYTRVTDDGLRHLAKLKRLSYLNLHGTSISTDGVRHLAQVASLRDLDLGRTRVDDRAVEFLATMPFLIQLSIGDTRMTDAAVPRLRNAPPSTEVVY